MWKMKLRKHTRRNSLRVSVELDFITSEMVNTTDLERIETYSKIVSNLSVAQKNLTDSYFTLKDFGE